ncbi:MAG: hypothetical protein MUF61_01080 [archaeon]|jgi:hypothetical protein|nr:hypothetical protein [archaeon]
MGYKNLSVSLVAVLALAIITIASVSAYTDISVEVNGIEYDGDSIAVFAGQTVPVKVTVYSSDNATDVRIKAWISGDKDLAVSTGRFDMISDKTYSRMINVQVPSKVDPSEDLSLIVDVESRDGSVFEGIVVPLTVQRESYALEILDAVMDNEARAGSSVTVDIVLKNTGRHFADDTFVKVRIPALNLEKKSYFGDLSPVDQADPDKEDATEKRMFLNIPSNAATGLYLVEIEAYNADSSATLTKKLSINGGASDSTLFVASATSKSFAVGEKGTYGLTLVNSGDKIRVYELVSEAPSALSLSFAEPVVVVPAGESKSVSFDATAAKEGKYSFAVNVYSDGELVKKYNFVADATSKSSKGFAGNATVILTIVLAVIFVILLVVLIVLLTKKPEKTEEFGESYY